MSPSSLVRHMLVALAVLVFLPSAPAFAQSGDCFYQFTTGAGAKKIAYCVSPNANLVRFESPAGSEHIFDGDLSFEGYAVCSATGTHGHDYSNFDEGGFGASTTLASSSSGVTIQRSTTDGVFKLVTKFSRDTKEMDLTVAVTLTNLTAVAQTNVQYRRLVNLHPNTAVFSRWHATPDEVTAYVVTGGRPGASLNALSFDVPHTMTIEQLASSSLLDCAPDDPQPDGTSYINGAAGLLYNLGTIGAGKSKTVSFGIKRH